MNPFMPQRSERDITNFEREDPRAEVGYVSSRPDPNEPPRGSRLANTRQPEGNVYPLYSDSGPLTAADNNDTDEVDTRQTYTDVDGQQIPLPRMDEGTLQQIIRDDMSHARSLLARSALHETQRSRGDILDEIVGTPSHQAIMESRKTRAADEARHLRFALRVAEQDAQAYKQG